MIAATTTRVADQTAPYINADIRRQIEANVRHTAAGGVEAITRRLAALDHEWDIERTLEANAATASLIGLTLGAMVHQYGPPPPEPDGRQSPGVGNTWWRQA